MPENENTTIGFEDRLNFILQNLQRIDQAVDRADNKSANIAAANVGLFSVLLAVAAILGEIGGAGLSASGVTLVFVLFILYLIPSTLSTFFSLSAMFPRLTPGVTSLFFFGTVYAMGDVEKFSQAMGAMSPDEMIEAVEIQVFANSGIAQTKFRHLKWSVRMLVASGLMWTAIMVLLFLSLLIGLSG
jgi:hypothetical protein